MLAYAVSVHKSQGSEYPCVVIPLLISTTSHAAEKPDLHGNHQRKKLVVLVGSKRALAIAVKNDKMQKRYTHA